jgi:hypothetical protein
MLVSLTRLRIASARIYPWAILQSLRTARHAARTPGFRSGRILRAQRRVLWTITGWDDEAAMLAYRGTGLHSTLMAKLMHWCDEAAVARWTQDNDVPLPAWPQARERLQKSGRRTKVRHPSADQQTFVIAPLGDTSRIRELNLNLLARRRR